MGLLIPLADAWALWGGRIGGYPWKRLCPDGVRREGAQHMPVGATRDGQDQFLRHRISRSLQIKSFNGGDFQILTKGDGDPVSGADVPQA